MADNVTLPGDDSVIATDEVDGKHYQRVKIDVGGEGASSFLSSANPLPVTIPEALVPESYDSVEVTEASGLTQSVVFKKLGVTVATLTFTYTDSNHWSVARS